MAAIKYISLNNLTLYDQLIKNYINVEDQKSLKTVALSQNGKALLFYRDSEPIQNGATPAYSITLPETNLDSCMKRILTALQGNVAVFDANGQAVDGGIALSDLVTETEAAAMIAEQIANTTHMTAQIVSDISQVQNPSPTVLYLVKDTSVAGADKYKEYMYIGEQMTLIGDTTMDVSNFMPSDQIQNLVSTTAQSTLAAAATDAQAKADKALADAKDYTDQQIENVNDVNSGLADRVDALETTVGTQGSTIADNTSRIVTLEGQMADITIATESDIRGLFSST